MWVCRLTKQVGQERRHTDRQGGREIGKAEDRQVCNMKNLEAWYES